MIAELLLVLVGHDSSLFDNETGALSSDLAPLLHPGEKENLEWLSGMARKYRGLRAICSTLMTDSSPYVDVLCRTLLALLSVQYEGSIVSLERKALEGGPEVVARGPVVALSVMRVALSEWEFPLSMLKSLMERVSSQQWRPGPLIDLLVETTNTSVAKMARIMHSLLNAVLSFWKKQISAFVLRGSLSSEDPIAASDFSVRDDCMPTFVSTHSRQTISYIGRAIATVKGTHDFAHPPLKLIEKHASKLAQVEAYSQDFDASLVELRNDISDWLWNNVLTKESLLKTLDSMGAYFLTCDGDYISNLIREMNKLGEEGHRQVLKISPVRDVDLQLALFRASIGTAAQDDQSLAHLQFLVPQAEVSKERNLTPASIAKQFENIALEGCPVRLAYKVYWPLDLLLQGPELEVYSSMFSYLIAVRKVHSRVHEAWSLISQSQRANRSHHGFIERGTEDEIMLRTLGRRWWALTQSMAWLLDLLLNYLMGDVVQAEFQGFRSIIQGQGVKSNSGEATGEALDLTRIRVAHTSYLLRIFHGSLLSNTGLASNLRDILECCNRLYGQVRRWGGDILPPLLEGEGPLGQRAKSRWTAIVELEKTFLNHLSTFYEKLSHTAMEKPWHGAMDKSTSGVDGVGTVCLQTGLFGEIGYSQELSQQTRRLVERLLLQLDCDGRFSREDRSIPAVQE